MQTVETLTTDAERAAIQKLAEFASVAYNAMLAATDNHEVAEQVAVHVANLVTPLAMAELQQAVMQSPRAKLAL